VEDRTPEDSGLQDGRDEVPAPGVSKPPPDYSDLLGPTSSLYTHERTYSLLVYFPVFSLSQEQATWKEKDMLLAIMRFPTEKKVSGAVRQLTTTVYPRIRLIPSRSNTDYSRDASAALIMDDNPERLRRIQTRLHAAQHHRWSTLDTNWARKDLFFVRSWGESPVVLIFAFKTGDRLGAIHATRLQQTAIDEIFRRYPILASYQCDSSSSGPRIAVGKAALYHGHLRCDYDFLSRERPQNTYVLIPLFNIHPLYPDAAINFAEDFATEHSGRPDASLFGAGVACNIFVDRMRNPELWSSPGGAQWGAPDSG